MSALDRKSPIPLYHQMKSILQKLVQQSPPHARLPAEQELALEYGVSRGTVKQAITELVQQGLLYRVQGKGTFVAAPQIHQSFAKLTSFTEDIEKQGYLAETRVLDITRIAPPDAVARELGREQVWYVHRIRLADGEPLAVLTSYLPVHLVPHLEPEDVAYSLYDSLDRRYGRRPVRAHDTYRASLADRRTAALLGVPVETPVLKSTRTAFLENGQPVEYVEAVVRGDRYVLHVDINDKGAER